jgi:hypothetical protein
MLTRLAPAPKGAEVEEAEVEVEEAEVEVEEAEVVGGDPGRTRSNISMPTPVV